MADRRPREVLAEAGPLLVRLLAGAGLALVAVILLLLVIRSGPGGYEVTGVFDDVRGVIVGGDVTAGFQKVGKVEDIYFGDDGLPRIKMRVDDDFPLHQGAFANIRLYSNVGAVNRVVDLQQGDLGAPELADGATLGPSSTDQPVDLDLATSTLDPKTREDAAALLAGLDLSFRGRGDDLNRSLRHSSEALNETANLLGEVNSDGAAIQSLVDNASTVVTALADNSDALGSSAERTATLLGIAARRQLDLRRSLAAIGPALGGANVLLNRLLQAVPNLRALVSGTRPLVDELQPAAQQLPATVAAARPTLGEIRALVDELPSALRKTQPALDVALPVVEKLAPSVDLLNPFLDQLRVRIPEITGFFQLGGDATSDYDANGNLVRADAVLIQSNRHPNIIGPDQFAPGSVESPFDRVPGLLENEPWPNYGDSFIGGAETTQQYLAEHGGAGQ